MKHRPEGQVRIGKWVVHPLRAVVPEMPPEMLKDLTDDIREAGTPTGDVIVDAENRILDGRAQLRACLAAGVQPRIVRSPLADQPATVIARSVRRTPYTGAQCSIIAARLSKPLSAEARDRQRNAGRPLPKNTVTGEAPAIAAKMVGNTNPTYVTRAVRLLKDHPDIVDVIESGKVERMSQAAALAAMPEKQRKTAIRDIKAGKDPALVIDRRKKVDDEWHTPADICDAVRAAFGRRIACDPCAPERGSHVDAEVSYTKARNGLDEANNPWYDFTFVNPPFSKAKDWVKRALTESTFQDDSDETQAKRIYVLLPVRPDSAHQADLINAAIDVLFLADRVAFDKPGEQRDGTGRISVMIAGLNISTHDLITEGGLQGIVVRKSPPPRLDIVDFRTEDELRMSEEASALAD